MGYGMGIVAMAMVFFLMASNVQLRTDSRVAQQNSSTSAYSLARDMLRLASVVNDWRYARPLGEGMVNISQFGMVPTPDTRIKAAINNGRLWVWSSDTQGLLSSLTQQAVGSALICIVSGGRLKMTDGTDMNLPLPSGVMENNIVYLN